MSEEKQDWKKQLEGIESLEEEEQKSLVRKILDESDEYSFAEQIRVYQTVGKIVDKLEMNQVVEKKEDMVLEISKRTFYKVTGVIFIILSMGMIGWTWYRWERIWISLGFLLLTLLGVYIFGIGKFCKVDFSSERLVYYSPFFGKKRTFSLQGLTRVYLSEDGKRLKVYRGKKKTLTLGGKFENKKEETIPYFRYARVKIYDDRPYADIFSMKQNNVVTVCSVLISVLLTTFLIYWGRKIFVIQDEIDIIELFCFIGVLLIDLYTIYLSLRAKAYKVYVDGDEITIYNILSDVEKEIFHISDITGYKIFKKFIRGRVVIYHEQKNIIIFPMSNTLIELFVAKMNMEEIPCIEKKGRGIGYLKKFDEKVKVFEDDLKRKDGYLYRW